VKKNFTLEYGVRFSKMTNNVERNGLGARFDVSRYDPSIGAYRDDQELHERCRLRELARYKTSLYPASTSCHVNSPTISW
jgi:hypothetical protein